MLVDLCRRAPSQLIILALLCFSVKASHNVSFSPMVEGYSTTNTTLLQMPQVHAICRAQGGCDWPLCKMPVCLPHTSYLLTY